MNFIYKRFYLLEFISLSILIALLLVVAPLLFSKKMDFIGIVFLACFLGPLL